MVSSSKLFVHNKVLNTWEGLVLLTKNLLLEPVDEGELLHLMFL